MKVRPLSVGPILGYTTPEGTRIFGRAQIDRNWDEDWAAYPSPGTVIGRRCFLAVRVRRAELKTWRTSATYFARQMAHFDFTGVAVVRDLEPDTEYVYQAGWIEPEDFEADLPDPVGDAELDWKGVPEYRFTTATPSPDEARSFVFGSCRYLLRLFGGWVFEGRGDKTFRSILRQHAGGSPTHAVLMLGDQIYADDLNVIDMDKQVDEYLRRYRAAFGQEHMRALMAQVPTYMTLDDHEIEDNWPVKASRADFQVKYPAAMHAYSIYQMSHSPLPSLDEDGTRLAGMPHHWWYTFSDGCCDFFVLDTRTERYQDEEIIGQDQMRALKDWLADGSGQVKIICSAVPVFPDYREPSGDKWSGFLAQRDELLNFIYDRRIRKVIILSGDVHCSMAVELRASGIDAVGAPGRPVELDPDFRILSIVSSPFYWPYPHPRRKKFQLDGRLTSRSPYGFDLRNPSEVVCNENFTRVRVSGDEARVDIYGRKGELYASTTYAL